MAVLSIILILRDGKTKVGNFNMTVIYIILGVSIATMVLFLITIFVINYRGWETPGIVLLVLSNVVSLAALGALIALFFV